MYRTLLETCEYGVCTHCQDQWSNSQLLTPNVTTQVVWCPKKWIGWVLIMGGMMPSVRTNLAHKRYDYPAISWLQNLNLSFQQRRFPFFSRTFPATRARGSRDLRPRVTRPAPAGHTTCARGSLTFSDFEMELYDFGLANTDVGMCRRPPNIHFHQKIVINQRQILISAVDL